MKKILNFIVILTLVLSNFVTCEAKEESSLLFPSDVYSENYLMLNLENSQVIFEKGKNERINPASMTKVMTALIIIENTTNYDKKIVLNNDDISLIEKGATIIGLNAGAEITVNDALHGMLLASSSDMAHALAVHLANSEDEFVKLMNKKAKHLNMTNTNFVNCTGLYDKNHYTTLSDYSILFKYCLSNSKFKEIIEADSYDIVQEETPEDSFHINSYTKLLYKNHGFNPSCIIGAKSGYLPGSGDSIVVAASIDGLDLLFLCANAPVLNIESKATIHDSIQFFDYIVSNYRKNKIFSTGETYNSITINEDLYLILPKNVKKEDLIYKVRDASLDVYIGHDLIYTYHIMIKKNYKYIIYVCEILFLIFAFIIIRTVISREKR